MGIAHRLIKGVMQCNVIYTIVLTDCNLSCKSWLAFTLTILRGKNGDNTDRYHFMDGENIFRNYLACLCCCCTEETNSDVKMTEISKFSSKFTPRRCNK